MAECYWSVALSFSFESQSKAQVIPIFRGAWSVRNEKENISFSLVLDIFRYSLWQCKLNKKLPTLAYISEEVVYMTNSIRKTSKEMCELFDHCTMFTRRDDGRGDGADQHGCG